LVEASVSEDGQGAHGGEDDEDPEEHAVHHHGHVLPVLFQLDQSSGWMGAGGMERKQGVQKPSDCPSTIQEPK